MTGKMGLYNDDFKKDFIRLTRAVHSSGGKVAIVISVGGFRSLEIIQKAVS